MSSRTSIGPIQRVRRGFASGPFYGLRALLEAFEAALHAEDYATCLTLTQEVAGEDYGNWLGKREVLLELRERCWLRQGGLELLRHEHERHVLVDPEADRGQARLCLGRISQRQRRYDAARSHYEACIALWEAAKDPRLQQAREFLFALGEEESTGHRHPFFESYWGRLENGVSSRERLIELAAATLDGPDWQQGRAAVSLLEELEDLETLAAALFSPVPQTRIAAVSALRNHAHLCQGDLVNALDNDEPLVRWQAAIALGEGNEAEASILALEQAAVHDQDPHVRAAAVRSLGRIGTVKSIAVLEQVPDGFDALSVPLSKIVQDAIEEIQDRSSLGQEEVDEEEDSWGFELALDEDEAPVPSIELPHRMPHQETAYVRRALAVRGLQLILGAVLLGIVNVWMAIGYGLYGLFVKRLIEPFLAFSNFFADKPCYTGRQRSFAATGPDYRRSGAPLLAFFYLPLHHMPTIVYLGLLLGRFSWWLLLLPFVAFNFLEVFRFINLTRGACPYCPARQVCPLWAHMVKMKMIQAEGR